MKTAYAGLAIMIALWACDTRLIPYRAYMGPEGGTLEGPDSTSIIIPKDALEQDTEIYIFRNQNATNLPEGTQMVYDLGTHGISLKKQAIFAVPSGACNPTKWSLNGTGPWLNLPRIMDNCPKGQVCAAVTVLGSIACTKGGWHENW